MNFFKKNIFNSKDKIGVDISDNSIKFAQINDRKKDNVLRKIGSLFLPVGSVIDGRIVNEEEVKKNNPEVKAQKSVIAVTKNTPVMKETKEPEIAQTETTTSSRKPNTKLPIASISEDSQVTSINNIISTDNGRTIISVSEEQIFELCGYKEFTAKTRKLTDTKQSIELLSSDRNIPKPYRSFQGYSRVLPTNQRVELWPECNVRFSYEYLSGKKRIVISY